MKDPHFDKVFWFCAYVVSVGLLMLAGLIWIPVPHENQSMASTAMGFITATVLGVPLAYIFGGNPNQQKKTGEQIENIADASITINDQLNDTENGAK